jgi:hypothetical protein
VQLGWLRSQDFRPANGRVTVLAYTQGVEDFTDANGDGQYSCTNYTSATGNPAAAYRPLVDTCNSGGEPFVDQGDPFLDADANSVYNAAAGDKPFPYNHPSYSAAGDGKWGSNYIRRSMTVVFSGSVATLTRQVCVAGTPCRDWTAADGPVGNVAGLAGASCANQNLYFRINDANNNPLPFGTTVAGADATKVTPGLAAPATVSSSVNPGGTSHQLTIKPEASCSPGSFSVVITTPKGKATSFGFTAN